MLAITDALSNLADVSRQLNEESDSVNDLIASVEVAINSANPGVEVWLNEHRVDVFAESVRDKAKDEDGYGLVEPVRYDTFWVIGYGRGDDGTWRILARQDEFDPSDDDTNGSILQFATSLVSCPRAVRIQAAPRLERLVERVTQRSQEMLDDLREAKAKAK